MNLSDALGTRECLGDGTSAEAGEAGLRSIRPDQIPVAVSTFDLNDAGTAGDQTPSDLIWSLHVPQLGSIQGEYDIRYYAELTFTSNGVQRTMHRETTVSQYLGEPVQAGGESCVDACALESDTQDPTFTFVPAALTIWSETGAIGQATAMDICSEVTVTNDAPAMFPVGTTTVTWVAEDRSGNVATATQLVTLLPGIRLNHVFGAVLGFGQVPLGTVNMTAGALLPAGTNLRAAYIDVNALLKDGTTETVTGVPIRLNRILGLGTSYAKFASAPGSPFLEVTITNLPFVGASVVLTGQFAQIQRPPSCGTSANLVTTFTLNNAGVAPFRLTRTVPWACLGNGLSLALSPWQRKGPDGR